MLRVEIYTHEEEHSDTATSLARTHTHSHQKKRAYLLTRHTCRITNCFSITIMIATKAATALRTAAATAQRRQMSAITGVVGREIIDSRWVG